MDENINEPIGEQPEMIEEPGASDDGAREFHFTVRIPKDVAPGTVYTTETDDLKIAVWVR